MSYPPDAPLALPPPDPPPPALSAGRYGLSPLPPEEPSLLWRVAARHYKLFLLCAAVSLPLALVAGKLLGRPYWQTEATLLYQPVNFTDQQRAAYQPAPTLPTLAGWLREPALLEQVLAECGLTVTAEEFAEKYLKVEQPNGTEVVSVSLKWPDREAGPRVLGRLLERYAGYVAGVRKETILRRTLQMTRQGLAGCQAEVQRLDGLIRDMEAKLARNEKLPDADLDGTLLARRGTLEDDIRKTRQALEEQREDLRKKESNRQQIEYLVRNRAMARQVLDDLNFDVKMLRLKVEHSEATIRNALDELRELPLRHARTMRSGQELKADYLRSQVKQLEADLALISRPGGPPARGVLVGMDAREFSVSSPPRTADQPASSNRKTIMALTFLLLMGTAFGLAAAHDRYAPAPARDPLGGPAGSGSVPGGSPLRARVVHVAGGPGGDVTIARVSSNRLNVRIHHWIRRGEPTTPEPEPPVTIGPDGRVEEPPPPPNDEEARHLAARIAQWLERGTGDSFSR